MSSPPQLPDARPPVDPMAPPKFLSPMLKSVLLVCVVSALSWLVAALIAVPLSGAAWVQELLHDNDLAWMSPSLQWLGAHAVGICVAMLLTCLVGVVACIGMLRREAWALWLFIVLLVVTALSNFVASWVVDDGFSHLLDYLDSDAANTAMRELRPDVLLQRIVFVGTALGTSLAFAILHGWLALRLLRADVRAYFAR